jgi:glycosyltransferase involved in cell wall biosynthesis
VNVLELCLSPDKGGLELYMLRSVRWFSRSNAACLAVVKPNGSLEALLREEDLRHRRLEVSVPWFPIAAARRLARWIEAENIDVIHVHWTRDLNLAVLARRFARRAVRIVQTRQMAITRPKHDWYHRALYRHVDLLLVITRRLKEEARQFLPLPPARIQVLPHGVAAPPPPARCTELRAKARVPASAFAVGLFGRIEPAKGQQVLIDALALLGQRGCDVYAVLFGHPMEARHLDDLRVRVSRHALDERVHYYGFHPRPEEIMGCFDCVVLTTYNETFGLVLVEAMRAGVVVIGTAAGGVPEIIDDGVTGLLVPPREPAALAEAIERLARDPELRRRLASAGKTDADARFNEEQHFARLSDLLKGGETS